MKRRWILTEINKEIARNISKQLKIDEIIARILTARGINTAEQARKFLFPDIITDLYTPFLFKEMEKAVLRIRKAIENHEKILIYGDRDVDGVSAASLVYRALKHLKADVKVKVPSGKDGYGLSVEVVKDSINEGITLIITVDNGITAFEAVEYAKANNIDVIITDHHTPSEKLPPAFAIINPKAEENYPFKELSGAGVAYKLVVALFSSYNKYFGKDIIVFDLETTGFNPDKDEIIEIGAVKIRNGMTIEEFHTYVRPGQKISSFIQDLTSITEDKLLKAPPPWQAIRKFYEFIMKGHKEVEVNKEKPSLFHYFKEIFKGKETDIILSGYNIDAFDMKFINRYLNRYMGKKLEFQTIDIFKLAQTLPIRSKKLENVARYFNIEMAGKYHSAIYDARVTAEILLKMLKGTRKMRKVLETFTQYAALGTIADIVPLINENRLIVKKGIENLRHTDILGFKILVEKLNINLKEINSRMLSWSIIPVLNSAGRMGMANLSLKLLITDEGKEAEEIVEKLIELNQARKEKQRINFEKVMEILPEKVDFEKDRVFVIDIKNIEHGVTGVIANRIKDIYYRPTAIMIVEDGVGMGTARSIDAFHLHKAFKECSDILEHFGGHQYAVAFSVKEECIKEFKKRINEVAYKWLTEEDLVPVLKIDTEMELKKLNLKLIKKIEELLEPFGAENDEPVFLIKNVKLFSMWEIGKNNEHIKMRVGTEGSPLFEALWWNPDKKEILESGKNYDMVVRINRDFFNGLESINLIVEDIKLS